MSYSNNKDLNMNVSNEATSVQTFDIVSAESIKLIPLIFRKVENKPKIDFWTHHNIDQLNSCVDKCCYYSAASVTWVT